MTHERHATAAGLSTMPRQHAWATSSKMPWQLSSMPRKHALGFDCRYHALVYGAGGGGEGYSSVSSIRRSSTDALVCSVDVVVRVMLKRSDTAVVLDDCTLSPRLFKLDSRSSIDSRIVVIALSRSAVGMSSCRSSHPSAAASGSSDMYCRGVESSDPIRSSSVTAAQMRSLFVLSSIPSCSSCMTFCSRWRWLCCERQSSDISSAWVRTSCCSEPTRSTITHCADSRACVSDSVRDSSKFHVCCCHTFCTESFRRRACISVCRPL